jgi:PKD repeat protein
VRHDRNTQKTLNADFSASTTSGFAPLTVNFSDLSQGDYSTCAWDFGDGDTSTQCSPSHTYTDAGNYTVSLTISGTDGSKTETKNDYIEVKPLEVDFSASPTRGVAPLTVNFLDLSQGGYNTCSWAFGDGGSSDQCNPSHTYTAVGSYTVSLTVSGPGGTDIETKNDFIEVKTIHADFSASPTSGFAPLTVNFLDLSQGNYGTCAWDFGDGSTSTQCSPSHTYTDAGNYTVSLTISGTDGSDNETKNDYVEVKPLEADFSASPISGVAPLTVIFLDLSQGNYSTCAWDFGDGSTSDQCNPNHTYTAVGSYTVSLTVSGPGGMDTETKNDFIEVKKIYADFSASPISGVAPLTVNFSDLSQGNYSTCAWDFGDGSTSDQCNPNHTYTAVGSYTVSLTVSGPGGMDKETKNNYILVNTGSSDGHKIYLPLILY